MNDPIAAAGAASVLSGRMLAVAALGWLAWSGGASATAGAPGPLLSVALVGAALSFTRRTQLQELGGLLLIVGLLGSALSAAAGSPRLVAAFALPGLLTLLGAALPLATEVAPEGHRRLIRGAAGYGLLGALLCSLGSFPAAGLVALVHGFPIAFDGFQSGWTGASQAVGAVFFFGLFGGFPILAALGFIAGLLATGRRRPYPGSADTLVYLMVYVAGIDLVAALVVAWLGRG